MPAGEPIIDSWQYSLFPFAFLVGFLASRFFMAFVCMPDSSVFSKFAFMFKIVTFSECIDFFDQLGSRIKSVDLQGDRIKNGESKPQSDVPGIFLITETYRLLMVVAAMLVCLAHGSNDVANAITPLLVVEAAHGHLESKDGYWVGSIGIALGLLTLGYKVMETVGKKVIKLNFVKGFCAQFATAIAIIIGSLLGLPLSTTHCMVGSLLGIVAAEKLKCVKYAYVI